MAKIGCRCGHIISDSSDNLPYKAALLPDEDGDRFFEMSDDIVAAMRLCRTIYQCERCGRLLVEEPDGPTYRYFTPELDPRPGVLRSSRQDPGD